MRFLLPLFWITGLLLGQAPLVLDCGSEGACETDCCCVVVEVGCGDCHENAEDEPRSTIVPGCTCGHDGPESLRGKGLEPPLVDEVGAEIESDPPRRQIAVSKRVPTGLNPSPETPPPRLR